MTTYLIRRVLLLIPTLIGITLLTFPAHPPRAGQCGVDQAAACGEGGGHAMTAEVREQMIKLYDLDKPWYVAYVDWATRSVHGSIWAQSFVDHRPVATKIRECLPITITLAGSAIDSFPT